MPNVNYRGKLPSQDPNAPPESGVTSIPLGSPWPPLGREQVVKLHEALVAFRHVCRATQDYGCAARALCDTLDSLGIGATPPKTSSYCAPIFELADRMKAEYRRERWEGDPPWTETMLRRVIYALRGFMCGWDKDPRLTLKEEAASEGLALLTLLRESGIESLLPKHMSLIGIPADELPSWPKDWVEESRRIDQKIAQAARLLAEAGLLTMPPPTRTWTHEEVAKVVEEVQQRSGLPRHAEGRAPTTATELAITAAMESSQRLSQQQVEELLQSTADVPRRQEGRWEEPPKRNCWTCRHDYLFGSKPTRHCAMMLGGDMDAAEAAMAWTEDQTLDDTLMPPKDSDGCPGWEPKNETAKRECWTCGSFHINNGCGKRGTASAALASHLRKMDDLIDGGASTTEVASMDLNCPDWERKS